MGFIVKNTTFCGLLDLICPHSCRGCGAIGNALCERCKNDILLSHLDFCPNCKGQTVNHFCKECRLPAIFAVGPRERLLLKTITDYKYHQARALASSFAEILDQILPVFAGPVDIVPLPTIRRHIRERGFDHVQLIAKRLGKLRGWKVRRVLTRVKNYVQVGADNETRKAQALEAYAMREEIDPNATYLLLDDVWTTGASMKAAIKKLQQAGALNVCAAVLAVSRLNHVAR